jgi:predicted phosphoribosyltransferase
MTTIDLKCEETETRFRSRKEAGRQLAGLLSTYAHRDDVLVLAIPRGGTPVAVEVATELDVPMDVLVVQKLSVWHHAWQPPQCAGAVSSGGVRALNAGVIETLRLPSEDVEQAIASAETECSRKEHAYRCGRPFPDVRGLTVILVDDSIETGVTMRAAIEVVRRHDPARVVAAAPVGVASACEELGRLADEVVCPVQRPDFTAVHSRYAGYPEIADEELNALVETTRRRWAKRAPAQ